MRPGRPIGGPGHTIEHGGAGGALQRQRRRGVRRPIPLAPDQQHRVQVRRGPGHAASRRSQVVRVTLGRRLQSAAARLEVTGHPASWFW